MEDIMDIIEEQDLDLIAEAENEAREKNRGRAYRRNQRKRHILRKMKIMKAYRHDNMPAFIDSSDVFHSFVGKESRRYGDCNTYWYVPSPGYLAKGKIHCSCPMCSFNGTTMQDKRRIEEMISDLQDSPEADSTLLKQLERKANR